MPHKTYNAFIDIVNGSRKLVLCYCVDKVLIHILKSVFMDSVSSYSTSPSFSGCFFVKNKICKKKFYTTCSVPA